MKSPKKPGWNRVKERCLVRCNLHIFIFVDHLIEHDAILNIYIQDLLDHYR